MLTKFLRHLPFFLLVSFTVQAQLSDSLDRDQTKFYFGLGFTNITYHLYYKNPTTESSFISGAVASGRFTPLAINLGYKLTHRINLQLGVAYGGSKNQSFLADVYGSNFDFFTRTRVWAIPITAQLILFNATKRFPIYATATLMPAWGKTKLEAIETRNDTVSTSRAKDTGVNVYGTAGIGFNYKIWRKLTGNAEFLFIKSNFTGENSKFYDWRGEAPKYVQLISSFGFGFTYNLSAEP